MIHIKKKKSLKEKKVMTVDFPVVFQWLKLCGFTAEGVSSVPGQGKTTGHVVWPKEKKKVMTSS